MQLPVGHAQAVGDVMIDARLADHARGDLLRLRTPIRGSQNTGQRRGSAGVAELAAGEGAQKLLRVRGVAGIVKRQAEVVVGDVGAGSDFTQESYRIFIPTFEESANAKNANGFDRTLRIDLHRFARLAFCERQQTQVKSRGSAIIVRQLQIGINGNCTRGLVHHFFPVEFVIAKNRCKGFVRFGEVGSLTRSLFGLLPRARCPGTNFVSRGEPNSHLGGGVCQTCARERV